MSERVPGAGSGKVTAAHRRRDALLYVRQSTLSQVQENTESLALQYELRRHAAGLGWDEQQITVIDEDLARSAATASGRLGFTDLVAAVGLGKVGIIIGREVSRLARNNADWYQVLDLCAITDTLIADADGIYHPGDFNDRLVLGLKGQMAEALSGIRHKASEGYSSDRTCPAQRLAPGEADLGELDPRPAPMTFRYRSWSAHVNSPEASYADIAVMPTLRRKPTAGRGCGRKRSA